MTAPSETIVVGVDGSEYSVEALRWALAEARLRGARLRAIHAWTYPAVSTYHEAAHVLRLPLADAAGEVLERSLERVSAREAGIEIDPVIREAPAAEALIAEAATASLLVIGSRGLGGFRGLLLGSVSQQCAQHAPCPVVIVREESS